MLKDFSLDILRVYIDWSPFFISWEMNVKYPLILEHPKYGTEAQKLFKDANNLLDKIIKEKLFSASAVFDIRAANSLGDDIFLYEEYSNLENSNKKNNIIKQNDTFKNLINEKYKTLLVLHTLRQQSLKRVGESNKALSDYIAPFNNNLSENICDYIGLFALTAGAGVSELCSHFEKKHDDYNSILTKALADRLAEAFAEYLHLEIRKNYWGYATTENYTENSSDKTNFNIEDLIKEKYVGIRPAPGYPACPDHTEKKSNI